jgi:hypothetical protein
MPWARDFATGLLDGRASDWPFTCMSAPKGPIMGM